MKVAGCEGQRTRASRAARAPLTARSPTATIAASLRLRVGIGNEPGRRERFRGRRKEGHRGSRVPHLDEDALEGHAVEERLRSSFPKEKQWSDGDQSSDSENGHAPEARARLRMSLRRPR